MGVFVRPDSKYYFLWLDGHTDAAGRPLREKTDVLIDAPSATERKENRARAERLWHRRMVELSDDGHRPPDEKPAILFRTFAAWFEQHVMPTRRGHEREAEMLPRLVAFFGHEPLTAIGPTRATEYMTHRASTTVGPSTINREVDLLKSVLRSAVPDYLQASPLFGMKRLHTPTPKRRLMSEDEERRLLAVMDPEDKAFFLVGTDTLTRLSDIIDLKTEDDHGATLWVADPKQGGGFEVPVSKRLRKALDALPKDRPFLFPSRRVARTERDRRNSVRQMLERYCAMTEPPIPFGRKRGGLSFHWATRRTGATRMLTRGVDPGTAQKVGRWKDPSIIMGIYHELLDDKARAAVEAVGSLPAHSRRKKTRGIRRKN